MGPFATRQVILLPFPFSDLSASKLRPALLLADADFAEGGLQRISHARASKLFTAHESLFQRAVGQLTAERHAHVVEAVVEMVRAGA